MATTLIEITPLVRALVGDYLSESNSWTDAEIIDSVNYACQVYAEKTGCTYVEESVSFSSGLGTMPVAFIRMERVINSGVVLDWTDKDFEDRKDPAWRNLVGVPLRVMVYDGNALRIVPSGNLSLNVGYLAQPVDLAADDDEIDPTIVQAHHKYLKFAAAAWLYMKDGDQNDMQKAQGLMNVFNSLIGKEPGKPPLDTEE